MLSGNYYTILGVGIDAPPQEIKRKYIALALRYHPDKGGSEELMKRLNVAYETLIDPRKRKFYDTQTEIAADCYLCDENESYWNELNSGLLTLRFEVLQITYGDKKIFLLQSSEQLRQTEPQLSNEEIEIIAQKQFEESHNDLEATGFLQSSKLTFEYMMSELLSGRWNAEINKLSTMEKLISRVELCWPDARVFHKLYQRSQMLNIPFDQFLKQNEKEFEIGFSFLGPKSNFEIDEEKEQKVQKISQNDLEKEEFDIFSVYKTLDPIRKPSGTTSSLKPIDSGHLFPDKYIPEFKIASPKKITLETEQCKFCQQKPGLTKLEWCNSCGYWFCHACIQRVKLPHIGYDTLVKACKNCQQESLIWRSITWLKFIYEFEGTIEAEYIINMLILIKSYGNLGDPEIRSLLEKIGDKYVIEEKEDLVPHFYSLGNVGVEKWFELMLCLIEKKRYSRVHELIDFLIAKNILTEDVLQKKGEDLNISSFGEDDPKRVLRNIIFSQLKLRHCTLNFNDKMMPVYLDLINSNDPINKEGETMLYLLNKLYNLSVNKTLKLQN